jgi:hypothetical protein
MLRTTGSKRVYHPNEWKLTTCGDPRAEGCVQMTLSIAVTPLAASRGLATGAGGVVANGRHSHSARAAERDPNNQSSHLKYMRRSQQPITRIRLFLRRSRLNVSVGNCTIEPHGNSKHMQSSLTQLTRAARVVVRSLSENCNTQPAGRPQRLRTAASPRTIRTLFQSPTCLRLVWTCAAPAACARSANQKQRIRGLRQKIHAPPQKPLDSCRRLSVKGTHLPLPSSSACTRLRFSALRLLLSLMRECFWFCSANDSIIAAWFGCSRVRRWCVVREQHGFLYRQADDSCVAFVPCAVPLRTSRECPLTFLPAPQP